MQEIAPNIFIDNNSLGLVTGIIRTEKGTVLVDPPLRHDEVKSWRSGTARLVTGDARYLICLDTNYDRLVSSKGTECTTIMQENFMAASKQRPTSSRMSEDTYLHAESHDLLGGSNRWMPPEIVYSKDLQLYMDDLEIRLEHHAGSNHAATWVILPKAKIVFVGDAVLTDQAPFLAYADLGAWHEDLKLLASRTYKGYQIVSARSGLVDQDQVRAMSKLIGFIQGLLEPLYEKDADLEAYYDVIPRILRKFELNGSQHEISFNRLRWGITTYYELLGKDAKGEQK